MTFADKLIKLRKKNGLSQENLADELGVSRQAISKWEGLLSVPDLQNVLKISELFGVTTDYLLKDEEDEAKTPDVNVNAIKASGASADVETNVKAAGNEACAAKFLSQGKTAYAESRDKSFAIGAGIFLIAMSVLRPIEASFIDTSVSGTVFFLLSLASVSSLAAAGITALLSVADRRLLGVSFCLLLVYGAVNETAILLRSIDDVRLLYGLISGAGGLVFSLLAVMKFYGKNKIRINKYALIILPSLCALTDAAGFVAFADWSGGTTQTFVCSFVYFAMFMMAAILFREDGLKTSEKDNLGIAGVTLLALSVGLNALYLLLAFCGARGEMPATVYYFVSTVLYAGGFVLLPWLACFDSDKPHGSLKLKKGYTGLVRHILLTCYTCLVGHYVWVYKTSAYLNGFADGEKRICPKAQLVMYIFVPFYYIIWFYKHGQVISEAEKDREEGASEINNAMIAFAAFMPFVGSAIMQNRINALAFRLGEETSERKG